ncbi:MAG: transposase domain-containing protein [Firmicutes bacterium]|nr:transposase domain-containing protein [Bacillota bacterium]
MHPLILFDCSHIVKVNGLKPYEYFQYLLESILEHLDDAPASYLDDLMPWSDKLPEECRHII